MKQSPTRTVTKVMLMTLAVGLTSLVVESLSEVSWLPVVTVTVMTGIATYVLLLVESCEANKQEARGVTRDPVFVRVANQNEAQISVRG